jgi:beta-glucosidase
MITTVGQAQTSSIVVLHSTGAVDTSRWIDDVDGLLVAFMPGSVDGAALVDIVVGVKAPGGRLPVTFASAMPFDSVQQYPGVNNVAVYSEELLVGYKWYASTPKRASLVQASYLE